MLLRLPEVSQSATDVPPSRLASVAYWVVVALGTILALWLIFGGPRPKVREMDEAPAWSSQSSGMGTASRGPSDSQAATSGQAADPFPAARARDEAIRIPQQGVQTPSGPNPHAPSMPEAAAPSISGAAADPPATETHEESADSVNFAQSPSQSSTVRITGVRWDDGSGQREANNVAPGGATPRCHDDDLESSLHQGLCRRAAPRSRPEPARPATLAARALGAAAARHAGPPRPSRVLRQLDVVEAPNASVALAPLSTYTAQAKEEPTFLAPAQLERFTWPAAVDSLFVEAGRSLKGFVDQVLARAGESHKTLALAGCRRGAGTTTVTLALAKTLADRGLRPLVVEADFERPCLARLCGVSTFTGWGQVVESDLPPKESLVTATEEQVTLMPWRGGDSQARNLVESGRLADYFATLRSHFDVLLLDLSPLASTDSTTQLAALSKAVSLDAVYLIEDLRDDQHEPLTAIHSRLRRAGVNVEGIIENFVAAQRGGTAHLSDEADAKAQHQRGHTDV